jgi:hypothetical protein
LFEAFNITTEFGKYCQVVGSLQHDSLRRVADIIEAPPADAPYEAIKQRLLSSHQLTSYQRAEKLFAMPLLGARKPSELMSEMLEICPRGEEKSELFACLFLQRIPREIRVLLASVDHKDPKALAEQADHYWGLHEGPSPVAAVTAVEQLPEEQLVAAVRSGGGGRGARGGRGRRGNRGGGGGGNRTPIESDLSRDARLAAGLCLRHWRYGEHANSCEQPCNWPGNGAAGGN